MRPLQALGLALTIALAAASAISANGPVQREIAGRVVAVDARAGTFVVERDLRGKVWRLILQAAPATPIFTCHGVGATLGELRPGDLVSVYYEPMGREGLANLVVIEPRE